MADDAELEILLREREKVSLEPLDEVLKQLRTNPVQGLSPAEVKLRREIHGMNVIEPPLSFPKWLCCLLPCLRNTHAMQLFSQAMAESATVIRGGNKLMLDAVSLVPGDIVCVQSGDRIAADMRVVRIEFMLAVDKSFSTGNQQTTYISTKTYDSEPRARSVLLAGDFVMEGSATCVVTATGSNTYISKQIQTKRWPPRPSDYEEALLQDSSL